jgi:hypothetical protein
MARGEDANDGKACSQMDLDLQSAVAYGRTLKAGKISLPLGMRRTSGAAKMRAQTPEGESPPGPAQGTEKPARLPVI